jgi:hypothetical protein
MWCTILRIRATAVREWLGGKLKDGMESDFPGDVGAFPDHGIYGGKVRGSDTGNADICCLGMQCTGKRGGPVPIQGHAARASFKQKLCSEPTACLMLAPSLRHLAIRSLSLCIDQALDRRSTRNSSPTYHLSGEHIFWR